METQRKEQTAIARNLRLLIQQVQTASGKSFRLIAYGDGDRYRAPEFESVEALLAILRRGIPDLDLPSIALSDDGSGSSIVYAADVRLTDAQRTALGLIRVLAGKAAPPRLESKPPESD